MLKISSAILEPLCYWKFWFLTQPLCNRVSCVRIIWVFSDFFPFCNNKQTTWVARISVVVVGQKYISVWLMYCTTTLKTPLKCTCILLPANLEINSNIFARTKLLFPREADVPALYVTLETLWSWAVVAQCCSLKKQSLLCIYVHLGISHEKHTAHTSPWTTWCFLEEVLKLVK